MRPQYYASYPTKSSAGLVVSARVCECEYVLFPFNNDGHNCCLLCEEPKVRERESRVPVQIRLGTWANLNPVTEFESLGYEAAQSPLLLQSHFARELPEEYTNTRALSCFEQCIFLVETCFRRWHNVHRGSSVSGKSVVSGNITSQDLLSDPSLALNPTLNSIYSQGSCSCDTEQHAYMTLPMSTSLQITLPND